MNKKFLHIFLLLTLLVLSLNEGFSQHKPKNRYHSRHLMYMNNIRVTGMVGLSSYYGDLCDDFLCFRYRPGITVGAYYRYNGRISFRGDLTYLRLSGHDKNGDNARRNLSFKSPNLELAAGIMYDLIYFERNYHIRAQFTPYLFLEAGMFYFNPKAEYNGTTYALRPLKTEGVKYNSITMAIPFGGGVRYKINSYMDVSFELAYRKTFTDYIDDVSTVYQDKSTFDDPVAEALSDRSAEHGFYKNGLPAGNKRGNPNKKDGYFLFGIKFEYMIATTQQLHNLNSMPRFRHRNPGMHRKYR